MGVEVIHQSDGASSIAALYSNTSDWAFGPLFKGPEAAEQAEAFLKWFTEGHAYHAGTECGIRPGVYADDPRGYSEEDLECLFGVWKNEALDDDGFLKEVVTDDAIAL